MEVALSQQHVLSQLYHSFHDGWISTIGSLLSNYFCLRCTGFGTGKHLTPMLNVAFMQLQVVGFLISASHNKSCLHLESQVTHKSVKNGVL